MKARIAAAAVVAVLFSRLTLAIVALGGGGSAATLYRAVPPSGCWRSAGIWGFCPPLVSRARSGDPGRPAAVIEEHSMIAVLRTVIRGALRPHEALNNWASAANASSVESLIVEEFPWD